MDLMSGGILGVIGSVLGIGFLIFKSVKQKKLKKGLDAYDKHQEKKIEEGRPADIGDFPNPDDL